VVTLLEHARQELLIVSNIPVVGVFSKEDAWLASKHAIEKALRSIPRLRIRAIFANESNRESFLKDQYRDPFANWEAWRSTEPNSAKIASLIERFGADETVSTVSTKRFLKLMEIASTTAINVTLKGAEICVLDQRIPLYAWIADGQQAIFAIPASVPIFAAQAFWTQDARLISALISMHEEYRNQAQGTT
jgi:hypothetical protein